jgi:oligoribonuclease NrnB/cAMP/cGMP phosphodiesterase (DHH superfamily)
MLTIIYHSADYDGLMSGAIMRLAALQTRGPFRTLGWDYGDPVPEVSPDDQLYIVDLAIPELMNHPRLIWIDHHKTSIDLYDRPEIPGYRIDGVAACRLCWQWVYIPDVEDLPTKEQFMAREVSEPWLVRMLGEYDIWDDRDPDARPLQLGLKSEDVKVTDLANHLGRDDLSQVEDIKRWVTAGRTIERYNREINRKTVNERGYRLRFEGLDFIVLNSSRVGDNSIVFEDYDGIEEVDACMLWRFDGDKIVISLYHSPTLKDLDLSTIARVYGGGGHRGACGFTLPATHVHAVMANLRPEKEEAL